MNAASVYVGLVPIKERKASQFALMKEARKVLAGYPELRASVSQVSRISGGGRSQRDLTLVLQGPDLAELDRISNGLVEEGRKIPGFVDVDTTLEMQKPEVRVWIDRPKAADLGVSVEAIARSPDDGGRGGGHEVQGGDEQYPVRLRLQEESRKDRETIARLSVPSTKGPPVPLENLVRLTEERSPAQIDRYNRARQVMVVANFQGIHLKQGQDLLAEKVRALSLPAGYNHVFIGRSKIYEQAIWGVLLGDADLDDLHLHGPRGPVQLVPPPCHDHGLPPDLPSVRLSLAHARGDDAQRLQHDRDAPPVRDHQEELDPPGGLHEHAPGAGRSPDAAIIEANHTRLRPILMTTFAVVAGMLPIALGRGDGAASRASTAMVIVGGQMLALVLTLLITPVVYSLLDDLRGARPGGVQRNR